MYDTHLHNTQKYAMLTLKYFFLMANISSIQQQIDSMKEGKMPLSDELKKARNFIEQERRKAQFQNE